MPAAEQASLIFPPNNWPQSRIVNRRVNEGLFAPLRVRLRAGERVDAVIFEMAAVAFYPMPLDPVAGDRVEQLLPQIGVLDRLLVRGPPAVALPAVDPARDPLADIIAICGELDPARL